MDRERIKNRFDKKTTRISGSDCIVWAATKTKTGYGLFWLDGRMCSAHRISYKLNKQWDLGDYHVLHQCDNPSCVNPDHLVLGTHQDNMIDRGKKNRTHRAVGEKNHQAKLTAKDVFEIKATEKLRGSGVSLANKFGVSPTKIAQIRNNKAWIHLYEQANKT